MIELEEYDLIKVSGGAFTSSLLNAITKAAIAVYSFGQIIGSNIRRIKTNSYCPV